MVSLLLFVMTKKLIDRFCSLALPSVVVVLLLLYSRTWMASPHSIALKRNASSELEQRQPQRTHARAHARATNQPINHHHTQSTVIGQLTPTRRTNKQPTTALTLITCHVVSSCLPHTRTQPTRDVAGQNARTNAKQSSHTHTNTCKKHRNLRQFRYV